MFAILHLFYYLYRALDTNICLHVKMYLDKYIAMDIVRHINENTAIESTLNICKE